MKDYTVEMKEDDRTKVFRINIDNGKGMVIKKDKTTGKIIVTDESGNNNPEIMTGQQGELEFNGKKVVAAYPDDIVIFTHSSPGCAYYWDSYTRTYIWRCT